MRTNRVSLSYVRMIDYIASFVRVGGTKMGFEGEVKTG